VRRADDALCHEDLTGEERPAAPEKPKRGTLHIHRAKEHLGFVPSRPLETGYREYCSWYVNEWNRAKKMVGT
jgi:nucleoside-diphosphate-sugar epimerase